MSREKPRSPGWAAFYANHPEVVAVWGENNGREPNCRCEPCIGPQPGPWELGTDGAPKRPFFLKRITVEGNEEVLKTREGRVIRYKQGGAMLKAAELNRK